jgi:hypothetical protein
MRSTARSALVLLVLACLSGCGVDEGSNGPELSVEVRANGSCFVGGVAMSRTDVPRYLQRTLELPPTTYIAVTASGEQATHEAMSPVIGDLKAAGYKSVIGLIEIEPNNP